MPLHPTPSPVASRNTGIKHQNGSLHCHTNRRKSDGVTENEAKIKGKGRPAKIYASRATIDEIIGHYKAKKSRDAAKTIEVVRRLKELDESRRSG
jgi:predicted transcriptional regulator